MVVEPFYDPAKSYEQNFAEGPFGAFADGTVFARGGPAQETFLGHDVGLPLGIAAGPLLNGKYVKAALDKGFDLPVYKTVRTRRYASHAWPNVLAVSVQGDLRPGSGPLVGHTRYAEPLSITNSFGVPSFDPEFWQPDMADAARHAREGQMVIGSFQGTKVEGGGAAEYIADFVAAARLVNETGVLAMEANLSCPNEGTANLLCFDPERCGEIVRAIRGVIGETRLLVKVSYYADDAVLRRLVERVGHIVDGIVAINTIQAEVVDATGAQALPGEGRLRSGVCGRSIRWAGLEMTERLVRLRDAMRMSFAVVGVGGVSDFADYAAYRAAGADAVMTATAAMWNPLLADQIARAARGGGDAASAAEREQSA